MSLSDSVLTGVFRADLFVGRSVLVTGGTSGIGAGIASAFAALGADVWAAGLPGPGREPDAIGDAVTAGHVDVTDDTALVDLLERMGDVDVLVNCAGIALEDGSEHTPDGWDRVLRVNLTAAMRLSTFARPRMAGRAASIVNIASMYSTFGSGLIPAYAASKGALVQLTKSLAQAYAADGVRVNAIAPGWIDTPLGRGRMEDPKANAEILSRTPLGAWGIPQDVAAAAVFLSSPAASYVTGSVLPVDGGYMTV